MAVFKAYITNESAERQVSMDSFCAHSKLLGNLAVPAGEKRVQGQYLSLVNEIGHRPPNNT